MAKTKEEMNAYQKAYRAKNKKKSAAYHKVYYVNNKKKVAAYQAKNLATPEGIKKHRIKSWKYYGVIGNLSKMYDERYILSTECEVCNKTYKSSKDRHLDHDHDTGLFRQVLCCACNTRDSWKNKVLCQPCNVKDNWRNNVYKRNNIASI